MASEDASAVGFAAGLRGHHRQRPRHCPAGLWPGATLRAQESHCLVPGWGLGLRTQNAGASTLSHGLMPSVALLTAQRQQTQVPNPILRDF